jgi:hypothetical protein
MQSQKEDCAPNYSHEQYLSGFADRWMMIATDFHPAPPHVKSRGLIESREGCVVYLW